MSDAALPRRIVCGVSCSSSEGDDDISIAETDVHTTRQAIDLAARAGGEVVFVHAVEWLSDHADGSEIVDAVRDQLAGDLEALSAAAEARGVSVRHELRLGTPWKQLIAVADEEQADLIAVSPRRERLSIGKRIFHGSTALRVLKESTRPVWVVEPDCGPPKRILALLDYTPVSAVVVEAARNLGGLYDAELYALCCLDYPNDIALQRLSRGREAIAAYHAEIRTEARERLDELTQGDEAWQLLLGEDWVVRLAPHVVEEKKIDLVVLGGVSKPRLAGALLGTTAQRLLDRVSVSTWMVRPE